MKRPGSFYGWKLLAALWLILLMNVAFPLYGAGVVNAYMATGLRFDRGTLGFGFAVCQWMTGLPGPLVALCVNRVGVRFTLALGTGFALAGALLMALWVHTGIQYELVFGVIVGAGIVTAGPIPTQSCVARWFVRRKALAMSLLLTGPAIGGFIAPRVLDALIAHFGENWRVGWWLIAGLSCVAMLLTLALVKESPADIGQAPDGVGKSGAETEHGARPARQGVYRTAEEWKVGQALRSRTFWLILLSALGFSSGYSVYLAHGVIHLRDLGYAPAQAAASFSIMVLAMLAGTLAVGAMGDRIEPRYLWAAGSAAFGAGMLLSLRAADAAGLYVYAIFLGVGFGMAFASIMTLPANYFGAKAYPVVIGIITAVGTTAGALGAFVAGYSYDRLGSYSRVFDVIAIACFAGSILALLLTPPVRAAERASSKADPEIA